MWSLKERGRVRERGREGEEGEELEWKSDENVLHKQVSVRRTK